MWIGFRILTPPSSLAHVAPFFRTASATSSNKGRRSLMSFDHLAKSRNRALGLSMRYRTLAASLSISTCLRLEISGFLLLRTYSPNGRYKRYQTLLKSFCTILWQSCLFHIRSLLQPRLLYLRSVQLINRFLGLIVISLFSLNSQRSLHTSGFYSSTCHTHRWLLQLLQPLVYHGHPSHPPITRQ